MYWRNFPASCQGYAPRHDSWRTAVDTSQTRPAASRVSGWQANEDQAHNLSHHGQDGEIRGLRDYLYSRR